MASITIYLLCIILPYILWSCQRWYSNYRQAGASGFPIVICPVNPNNVVWMIISVICRRFLAQYLPRSLYERVKGSIYGWEFHTRYEIFDRLGPAFIQSTPGKNELMIADPEMISAVLQRRTDFYQLDIASGTVNLQVL